MINLIKDTWTLVAQNVTSKAISKITGDVIYRVVTVPVGEIPVLLTEGFYIPSDYHPIRSTGEAFDIYVVALDKDGVVEVSTVGNTEIAVQDQTSPIIDWVMTSKLADFSLLTEALVDSKILTIETTGYIPLVNDFIEIKEGVLFFQSSVKSVASISGNQYTVTIHSIFDQTFTTNANCVISSGEMNVDGSTTPFVFEVGPFGADINTEWDITRMFFGMVTASLGDDGKFGDLPKLDDGLLTRKKNGASSKNLFLAQTNGDLAIHCFDVNYIPDTQGPSGQAGVRVRRTFNGQSKNGVVIRLHNTGVEGTTGKIQVVVQDDLTGLNRFRCVAQGQLVEGT